MCNMQVTNSRILAVILSYLLAQTKAYPMQGWPVYPQAAREYQDDEYYYTPKSQYYYEDVPALSVPEVYGQVPASYPYYYEPYGHFANEEPKHQEERLAALPVGQETWFESDPAPRWRANDDDVSAAFLDNLILTQMAQDAQRRRENTRAAFQPVENEPKDAEDEDVRELKALAGKPLYHVPKTVPVFEDDYVSDDGFINWNGNKRSVTTAAPTTTTTTEKPGQKEEVISGPGQHSTPKAHKGNHQNKRDTEFYDSLVQLLKNQKQDKIATKSRKIEKRFISGDSDLVLELRGLKHRIPT